MNATAARTREDRDPQPKLRPRDSTEARLRVIVRPIGTPLPLGLFAFAIGLVLVSGIGLGWFPPADRALIARILLAFVVPVDALATILAYLARDTEGATTMGLFGATWAALSTSWLSLPAGAESPVLGVFLFAVSTADLVLAAAALGSKPFISLLLGLTAARFIVAGLAELGLPRGLETAGSLVGLGAAALALYGGLAFLIEDLRLQTVLPLFRRGGANRALHADLDEQVRNVGREPGVRGQL